MSTGLDAENITILSEQINAAKARFHASGQAEDLVALRDTRVDAGMSIASHDPNTKKATPDVADLFQLGSGALPEVSLANLTIDRLRSAMHHYGALIVRGYFDTPLCADFRKQIDRTLDEAKAFATMRQARKSGDRGADAQAIFQPWKTAQQEKEHAMITFLAQSGAIPTFMSPRSCQTLLENFEARGLRDLLQEYFQETPCLTLNKSVLRRTTPIKNPAEWHQDGAFMDKGIHSLNIWVALTECGSGTSSPGMDFVPKRLTNVIETGTNGAMFEWSVSGATVQSTFADLPIVRPHFGEGDAIFFDHFNLHATSSGEEFTETRYAIETWFFAQSRCALNQLPVVW